MATVYLAANDRFFPKTDEQELKTFKEQYGIPDEFVLTVTKVYQGRKKADRKNVDSIVKAFLSLRNSLPSIKLVLAGEHCHRYISTVFGKDVADDPSFVYPGWIPQEDMPSLYRLARLFVFPSYSESFGIPLVEAMACGCPVVTSTGGSCPEVVGDAGLIVAPTDLQGLSAAMHRILTDSELRRSLSEKGLQRATEFSWIRSAARTIKICKEVHEGEKLGLREHRALSS